MYFHDIFIALRWPICLFPPSSSHSDEKDVRTMGASSDSPIYMYPLRGFFIPYAWGVLHQPFWEDDASSWWLTWRGEAAGAGLGEGWKACLEQRKLFSTNLLKSCLCVCFLWSQNVDAQKVHSEICTSILVVAWLPGLLHGWAVIKRDGKLIWAILSCYATYELL